MSKIATEIFGKNNTEALVISKKTQVPLRMPDRTDTNFIAPFYYISRDLKVYFG